MERRVRFNTFDIACHYPDLPLTPEECSAAWYTVDEVQANMQADIRENVGEYLQKIREGAQATDVNCVAYSRGLDVLDPEEKYRKVRCDLYKSLVVKQYNALRRSMTCGHASELLVKFATEKSRWARQRAAALAADDAKQARQVYREAFQSKEGVDRGLGITRRSLRGVKKNSELARTA
jgi:hypothetical protein